jgi:hypothetical protein
MSRSRKGLFGSAGKLPPGFTNGIGPWALNRTPEEESQKEVQMKASGPTGSGDFSEVAQALIRGQKHKPLISPSL